MKKIFLITLALFLLSCERNKRMTFEVTYQNEFVDTLEVNGVSEFLYKGDLTVVQSGFDNRIILASGVRNYKKLND